MAEAFEWMTPDDAESDEGLSSSAGDPRFAVVGEEEGREWCVEEPSDPEEAADPGLAVAGPFHDPRAPIRYGMEVNHHNKAVALAMIDEVAWEPKWNSQTGLWTIDLPQEVHPLDVFWDKPQKDLFAANCPGCSSKMKTKTVGKGRVMTISGPQRRPHWEVIKKTPANK